MPSAYVDGGGHMVAIGLIKSTHKYDEYKTGCYKDALGLLLHTLCVGQKILSNVRKDRALDLDICDGNPFKGSIRSQARKLVN